MGPAARKLKRYHKKLKLEGRMVRCAIEHSWGYFEWEWVINPDPSRKRVYAIEDITKHEWSIMTHANQTSDNKFMIIAVLHNDLDQKFLEIDGRCSFPEADHCPYEHRSQFRRSSSIEEAHRPIDASDPHCMLIFETWPTYHGYWHATEKARPFCFFEERAKLWRQDVIERQTAKELANSKLIDRELPSDTIEIILSFIGTKIKYRDIDEMHRNQGFISVKMPPPPPWHHGPFYG